MHYSDSATPRSAVIIDTGPIRELITYHAVYGFGFNSLRPELKHLVSVEAYENCGRFLTSFRKRITSASVVAELYYWIRDTDRTGQKRLWERAREEFENMGMEENVVRLLDMDLNLVAKYGPTDVSLIEIARQNRPQKPVILTLDNRLYAECWKAQIGSSLLGEVC
jgi:hypothetical protein